MGNSLPMRILFSGEVLAKVTIVVVQDPVAVEAVTDKPMVGRPGPVVDDGDQAVFDRVVVDVVNVSGQVPFVSYLVFPEASLPEAALSLFMSRQALAQLRAPGFEISTGEAFLDQPLSSGEVVVIFRQTPQAMQMVWQQA